MTNFNKHIVIVGTARSGTSWLSETIARQHRYRMLFEPEQETRTKNGYLLCDQWIEKTKENNEAHKYLKQVFENKVDCNWIAQNSNRKLKRHLLPFIPKKYIIKFVRANLLAKYINEVFNIPLIHIIRNPYDVILSQQRVKFPWLYNLSHFVKQEKLVNLIKFNFSIDICSYKHFSDVEILCIRWCIENVIPLEILKTYSKKSAIIKYEDLIEDINVFIELCHKFNIEPVKNIKEYYKFPSTKTHPESSIFKSKNNKDTLTNEEVNQINKILDIFKTKLYKRKFN